MELGDLFKRSLLSTTPEFKLALVGDGNVGKSAFIARHTAGAAEKRQLSALGAVVHPLVFYTNHGPIKFNVWDTIGQEKLGFVKDSFFINGKLLLYVRRCKCLFIFIGLFIIQQFQHKTMLYYFITINISRSLISLLPRPTPSPDSPVCHHHV